MKSDGQEASEQQLLEGNVGKSKLGTKCKLEGRIAEGQQVGWETGEDGGGVLQVHGQVDGLDGLDGRVDGHGQVEEWGCVGECGWVG